MSERINEFIEEADQWFDHGWRLEGDIVYSYTVDRKEQNVQKGRALTIEEFLNNSDIDIKARRWLKDLLGNSCDIPIEDDIPYKN